MQTIQVNGKEIKYRLRQGKSRKYITLKFLPDNELEIILPKNRKINVEALIKKKASLIEKKYRELANCQKILEGNILLFKGKRYQIESSKNEQPPENRVTIKNDKIRVISKKEEDVATIIKNWVTYETEQYVQRIIQKYSKNLKKKPEEVKKTRRWDYCTRKRTLIFNWQLIGLPPKVAEYIVLHEIAHLSEFNHQKAFHQILTIVCPNYKTQQKILRKYIPTSITHLTLQR